MVCFGFLGKDLFVISSLEVTVTDPKERDSCSPNDSQPMSESIFLTPPLVKWWKTIDPYGKNWSFFLINWPFTETFVTYKVSFEAIRGDIKSICLHFIIDHNGTPLFISNSLPVPPLATTWKTSWFCQLWWKLLYCDKRNSEKVLKSTVNCAPLPEFKNEGVPFYVNQLFKRSRIVASDLTTCLPYTVQFLFKKWNCLISRKVPSVQLW